MCIRDRAYTDSMLLNAEKDTFALSSFTTFEMEELMGLGERWALPILLYLFRRIEDVYKRQTLYNSAINIRTCCFMFAICTYSYNY